jgi:hypothetical protein
MSLRDAKIFRGNQYIQYFSVFLALSLVFLAVMQFFKSALGVTAIGSVVRLMASLVLLIQVFAQGERKGLFSRYISLSDIICIVAGAGLGFVAGYSFFSVAFSDAPLALSPVFQAVLDLGLASCLVYQLISE